MCSHLDVPCFRVGFNVCQHSSLIYMSHLCIQNAPFSLLSKLDMPLRVSVVFPFLHVFPSGRRFLGDFWVTFNLAWSSHSHAHSHVYFFFIFSRILSQVDAPDFRAKFNLVCSSHPRTHSRLPLLSNLIDLLPGGRPGFLCGIQSYLIFTLTHAITSISYLYFH